uniref:Uncharacterized protein n=1 Tax=Cucumis melo TaxID=3656 RepID=A0A9I9DU07_CUCME
MRYARSCWVDDRATQKVFVWAQTLNPRRVLLPVLPFLIMRCTPLKASLENTNNLIEEQRIRKEERYRQMVKTARQMEEMRMMIEEMSQA